MLIYCSNTLHCRHVLRMDAVSWADEVRLDEIEVRFVRTCCGILGAEVRHDWSDQPLRETLTGYQTATSLDIANLAIRPS